MEFGLAKDSMNNYDILLRQSNFHLIYPFNYTDFIEIPLIQSSSFYIFSNLSEGEGYSFISNSMQKEVEYFYLEQNEFDEKSININNLHSNITNTEDQYNIYSEFKRSEKIRIFYIDKNDHKAVIFKIDMDIENYNDFRIIRHSFGDYNKKDDNDNNKNKNKNSHISVIIISIIIIIVLIAVAVIKIRKIIINRRNDINIENINNELIVEFNQITPKNDNNSNVTPKISNNERVNNDNNIINNEIGNSNIKYKKPEEEYGKNINGSSDNSFSNIQRLNSIDSENNNFAPPPIALNYNNNINNNLINNY